MNRAPAVVAMLVLGLVALFDYGLSSALESFKPVPAPPQAVAYSVGQDQEVDRLIELLPLATTRLVGEKALIQVPGMQSIVVDAPVDYYRISLHSKADLALEQSAYKHTISSFYGEHVRDRWIDQTIAMYGDIELDGQRLSVDERFSISRDGSSYVIISIVAMARGELLVAVRKRATWGDALRTALPLR